MNSNHQLTQEEKYAIVTANRSKFNAIQNKSITQLEAFVGNTQSSHLSFPRNVQLETFFKCCRPAFESVFWEEEINYKVAYPIACIVAFKQPDEKYYGVDVKIASWAQSGGTRLMPLKASLSKEKLSQMLVCSHGLIVPQFDGQPQAGFFENIGEFIKQNKQYPVLALGNSAILLMSHLYQCQKLRKNVRMDLKFHNCQMTVFASHQDRLFRDLDLKVRLEIENKAKVMSSSVHLPLSIFLECKSQKAVMASVGKGKADDWAIVVARDELVHYCFLDPRQSGNNAEHVSFSHKLIVNFMQEIRKRQKKIEQKGIELGQYKVCLKDDSFFYNIDTKLPKF